MAQPGSFPNPNNRQQPVKYNSTPVFNNATQFPAMGQQRTSQRGPAHQFYQKHVANPPSAQAIPQNTGFFNQHTAPSFSQDVSAVID
ncbi:hypothetical protein PsorP6_004523 [Peronosclerospora sorghi]|uniref:Uncharacterized protein n=1 Tax=Peronosclerospora sorghi TaxID=230839 RepID=A0ACC0VLJ3_9STRA|nr:hypothetical protein PsorP6_004523 [Peronosclerospora sorghi]